MSNTDGAQPALPDAGPWTKYQTQPAADAAPADGPWTKYQEDYGKAIGSGLTKGVVGPLEAQVPTSQAATSIFGFDPVGAAAQWTKEHITPSWLSSGAAALRGSLPSPSDVAKDVTGGTAFDPSYEPKTTGGQIAQTAASFVPAAAVGPLDPAALGARFASQVAAPTATTEIGRQLGPGLGVSPETGAAIGGLATPFVLNPMGRALIPSEAVQGATETLGTRGLPAFAGSDSPLAATTAKVLSKVPGANIPLRSAAGTAQKELGSAAEGVAAKAGATTPDATGQAIEDSFKSANSGVSAAAGRAYDAVTNALPAGSETLTSPLSNTQAAADAITARNAASGAGPGAAVGSAQGALDLSNLSYQGMRDLRTRLRQQGQGSGLTPGERAEYGQLQDAVTQDINAHLDRLDPSQNASGLMKQADQTYQSDQGRIQAVGRKLGIDNASVGNEQYVNKVESLALGGSQNADLLGQVRQTLGPSVADQTASQIAKKWWTGSDGQFAPQQFVKKYNSLTPDAKNALFGPSGSSMRDSYDAIATLAARDPTLSSVLPSGGGGHGGGLGGGIVGGMIGAGAEGAIMHYASPETAVAAGAALPVPLAMSTLLSRPEVAAAAARFGRANEAYRAASAPGMPSSAQVNAGKILAAEMDRYRQTLQGAGADQGQQ